MTKRFEPEPSLKAASSQGMTPIGRGLSTVTLLALLIWIAIIVSSGAGWNPLGIGWDFSNPGAFGDSFGPLSALMASIAAVSAIAAYQSQRSETERLQKRQDEEDQLRQQERTRQLKRETELDDRSYHTSFEGTFFNLLQAFRQIVSETDIKGSSGTKSAHDAFKSILSSLSYNLAASGDIKKAWKGTAGTYQNDLNHYFRFLYHLVKYVDESRVADKYFYVRFVRAILSESEIVLLAINCEYGEGKEKFKQLIERYALLHNVSGHARKRWNLDGLFAVGAFERQQ